MQRKSISSVNWAEMPVREACARCSWNATCTPCPDRVLNYGWLSVSVVSTAVRLCTGHPSDEWLLPVRSTPPLFPHNTILEGGTPMIGSLQDDLDDYAYDYDVGDYEGDRISYRGGQPARYLGISSRKILPSAGPRMGPPGLVPGGLMSRPPRRLPPPGAMPGNASLPPYLAGRKGDGYGSTPRPGVYSSRPFPGMPLPFPPGSGHRQLPPLHGKRISGRTLYGIGGPSPPKRRISNEDFTSDDW